MKKLFRDDLSEAEAHHAVCRRCTTRQTTTRRPVVRCRPPIYPIVTVITDDGFRRLTEDEASVIARSVLERRLEQPDGRGPRCCRRGRVVRLFGGPDDFDKRDG
ncbi:hypothetical protein GCM10023238_10320 [Streptomyces heliomycini]